MKLCPQCKIVTDNFGPNKSRADGLQGWCRDCRAKYAVGRVAIIRARQRKWYDENRERKREYDRDYVKPRVEKRRQSIRSWKARHRDVYLERAKSYQGTRRARNAKGIDGKTFSSWASDQAKVCFYCGEPCEHDYHVDHFIPLAKGGAHVLTNLRIACASCNLHKSANVPTHDEWYGSYVCAQTMKLAA